MEQQCLGQLILVPFLHLNILLFRFHKKFTMVGSEQNGVLVNNNSVNGRRKKSRPDVIRDAIRDEEREMQLQPDPFTNNMKLGTTDWIVLGLGTIIILPFRVLAVVVSMVAAWFVAKIGLAGLPAEEVHSCMAPRSPWRVKLMHWYAIFGKIVFWSAGNGFAAQQIVSNNGLRSQQFV